MSNEELVEQIQSGVDVKKNLGILYQQNRNYIWKVVQPFADFAETDDLMQEAYFGLSDAVKAFHPEQGTTFLTYATYKIRRTCITYIEHNSNIIRIPAHMQQRIRAYKKLCKKYDDIPDAESVMTELNLSQKQYDDMILTIINCECISLDSVVKGQKDSNKETTVSDLIADPDDIEQDIIEHQLTELFWKCLDTLDDRSKEILLKRYRQDQTLKQIANDLGMTRQRVNQIEQKALYQLKVIGEIQDLADFYDYDCGLSYHSGIRRFKDKGISGTEELVLKRIELTEALERKQKKFKHSMEILQCTLYDDITLNRITELCSEKGVTIRQMEQCSGVAGGSFTKWKKGFKPSQKSLLKLSQFFNVSVAYITGDSDEKGQAEQEQPTANVFDRITALCNEKGIKRRNMEIDSGIGVGITSKWKSGKTPSQKSLKKIADYFNVSVPYLQGLTEIR